MLFTSRVVRIRKNVPEVLDTVLKTEGTVFPDMDQLRLVNKIFLF